MNERLEKLDQLLERDSKHWYVKNGRLRIMIAMKRISEIAKAGDALLDIGGHDGKDTVGYSFKEYTQTVVDCSYEWQNVATIDIRKDRLPYEDESFDVVVSSESIEHFR